MKIENPNPNSWSELPLDLLNLVFERLGFADFQRAKSICTSWHSASKQSLPKENSIPWLILFPEENNDKSCCMLFNPEEKDKLYKTKDLGFEEFSQSDCLATYGNWLLMIRDSKYLYILNLFTKELINLPSYNYGGIKQSPVFWIDEKTKDYVVLFGRLGELERLDVVYSSSKKKDNSLWNRIPETSSCFHLVYLDHKLYFLSFKGIFKIFDFSSSEDNIPKEIFHCGVSVERLWLGIPRLTQLVVSVAKSREEVVVFKVEKFFRQSSKTWSNFQVSKIYSSGFLKKKELVDSLGDEAILLDQGITVLAANEGGYVRNSIYYSDCSENKKQHNIFRFDLETRKSEPIHEFDSSSLQFSRARWFLPSFITHT